MERLAQEYLDLRPNGLVEQYDGSWPADEKHFRFRHCLINAVTVHVGTSPHFSGKRFTRTLAAQ